MNNSSTKKRITIWLVFTLLIYCFSANFYAANIQCEWTGVEKIVAVGDLHGDFKNFVKILQGTELIDEKLHWTGKKIHLVQLGDIMDRGPDAKKIFDLLMKLEKEAEAAGGKVHMLIGNHEEMNITGISFDYVGYVTVGQFVSFLPNEYKEKKEKEFGEKMINKNLQDMNSDASESANLRQYWQNIIKNNAQARKIYINNFNEKYGKWILEHNAIIKINDIIFLHGGISEKYSTWKLEELNNLLRKELDSFRKMLKNPQESQFSISPEIVYDRNGPLWYRGLAEEDEEIFKQDVDRILLNLNAHYIIVGHTIKIKKGVTKDNISRFQGRIWTIDTGITSIYGGDLSALIIEDGKFSVWGEK